MAIRYDRDWRSKAVVVLPERDFDDNVEEMLAAGFTPDFIRRHPPPGLTAAQVESELRRLLLRKWHVFRRWP